ncbi:hypothetical protein K443DRAFT_123624 [Laccaria amethystina LaAM-08-1]|uniref:Uncharacterized protein n=1 Tax=Laccaria amethystina LaAM-08-1 TaxID=1095629 RepID=A0A0C9X091_9AGAR|nr:hypothetical protein K443DRAFT_123624 [Laccaria amethystina LaAM-08-1]
MFEQIDKSREEAISTRSPPIHSYPLLPDLKTTATASHSHPLQSHHQILLPTPELKLAACVLAAEAGAAFVKTAVGFDGIAPTREDVWLMKVAVEGYRWGEEVKTFEACVVMLKTGAERFGTSSVATTVSSASEFAGISIINASDSMTVIASASNANRSNLIRSEVGGRLRIK